MKKLYLYIGTHKTGSTSLLTFLANAASSLREQGVLYPEEGRKWNGHHILAWAIQGKRGIPESLPWRKVREEVRQWEGDTIVIGSEVFWPCSTLQINKICEYLDVGQIQAVLHVRNPISYIISTYKQKVKSGSCYKSLRQFIADSKDRLDYWSIAHRWEESEGIEGIQVFAFDRIKKTPGLEKNFVQYIGANFEPLKGHHTVPKNVAPSRDILQFVRLVNSAEDRLGLTRFGERLTHVLGKRIRRAALAQDRLGRAMVSVVQPWMSDAKFEDEIDEEVINWLRNDIGERHARFLEEFVDPSDWSYLTF